MIQKWSELQLRFDLDLDEAAEDAAERAISEMEARQISEAAKRSFELRVASGGSDGPAWLTDYVRLVEQGWPWRVACYMAWASSPKIGRQPGTLKELSTEVLGLTGPRSIYTWRRKHPTIDTVVAMMQAAPLWEHRADVIRALVTSATEPDYKSFNDRKLFLEMTGDYVPKSKLELGKSVKASDETEMSDEELRQWLSEEGKTADDRPLTAEGGGDAGE